MCLHGDWSETAFRWIVSMSETTLMNFIQIDFPSDNERELYIALHHQMWSDALLNRLAEMGLVRKVLTKTWKKDNFRVVNCLVYNANESVFTESFIFIRLYLVLNLSLNISRLNAPFVKSSSQISVVAS